MKATMSMCQTLMLVADDDLLNDLEQLITTKQESAVRIYPPQKFVVEVQCPWWGTYIQGPYDTRAEAIEKHEVIYTTSVKPHVLVRKATDDDLQVLNAP